MWDQSSGGVVEEDLGGENLRMKTVLEGSGRKAGAGGQGHAVLRVLRPPVRRGLDHHV